MLTLVCVVLVLRITNLLIPILVNNNAIVIIVSEGFDATFLFQAVVAQVPGGVDGGPEGFAATLVHCAQISRMPRQRAHLLEGRGLRKGARNPEYICTYIYIYIPPSLSLYIYIYIYTYVCIYIYIYIYTHLLEGRGLREELVQPVLPGTVQLRQPVSLYACVYIHIYIYRYVCVYMCVCISVYMCVCIYIYICIQYY